MKCGQGQICEDERLDYIEAAAFRRILCPVRGIIARMPRQGASAPAWALVRRPFSRRHTLCEYMHGRG
jgi:hypothetical protein